MTVQRRSAAGPCAEVNADLLAALGALTECSSKLENEPLKGAVGGVTAELMGHVEQCCRKVVESLLNSLGTGDSDLEVYDKLWTLRLMGKRSEVTRQWIIEAGGLSVVPQAMALHPCNDKLHKEGAWLVYVLEGIDGVTELLRLSHGMPAMQESAAWVIHDLAQKQRDKCQAGTAEWPQANALVLLLLEAMRPQPTPVDLLSVCCQALTLLVEAQPCRGSLFVEHGGDEAVLRALGAGQAAGTAGESLMLGSMQLIAALVEGNAPVAQRLRALGALDGLVACGLRLPGKVTSEIMWTLGHVGGIMPVLQVMSRASDSQDAMQSGLAALAQLSWQPLEEGLQQQLPQAAEVLLGLARGVPLEGPSTNVVHMLQALGGVLHMLTPHVPPGSWPVADDGVALLVRAVGPGINEDEAQAAVASLGHIASHAPAWRAPLRAVLAHLAQRVSYQGEHEESLRHQKCYFWAAAVIAGLPVVLSEMKKRPRSANVQDAAISAIVDILEEHIEGLSSAGAESSIEPQHVPQAVGAVVEAMRAHRVRPCVQRIGCQALGLLHTVLLPAEDVPAEALDCILAAVGRHPDDYGVASNACSALRAFLEPRGGMESSHWRAVVARLAAGLRSRDFGSTVMRILRNLSRSSDTILLEDALYALGLVEGVPAVLRVLADSGVGHVSLRSAGLKALFELGRSFPDLMSAPQSNEVLAVASAIAHEASTASTAAGHGGLSVEAEGLLRCTELVLGMLRP